MQRILRINLQARNKALKVTRQKALDTYLKDWKDYETRETQVLQQKSAYIKAERKARREDWLLGPLAPRRDIGTKQDFYGTVSSLLANGPVFPPKVRKGPEGVGWDFVGSEGRESEQRDWVGEGNEGNLVQGDRVVVVRGKSGLIGQIAKVSNVAMDTKEVKLEGLNLADIEIPAGHPEQRESRHFTTLELGIPLSDVRLVHRLTDPTTGKDRDVVVKLLRGGAPYVVQDVNSNLPRHTRYIAGEDIVVPWPEADAPSYQAYPGDTTRYDVEAQTFMPTVWNPGPVPAAAFEDLTRNQKYKRDRRVHDDEYIRMKVLEDARAEWYLKRKIQGPMERVAEENKRIGAERTMQIKERGMSDDTRSIIEQTMGEPRTRWARKREAKRQARIREAVV